MALRLLTILIFFSACGEQTNVDTLKSFASPSQVVSKLIPTPTASRIMDQSQPRVCKSNNCNLVSMAIYEELIAASPGSILGRLKALDGWLTSDQEHSQNKNVPCLEKKGTKFGLDLSFNSQNFRYSLSCLSREAGQGSNNYIGYGIDYDTGLYGIRLVTHEFGNSSLIVLNEDDDANAEVWELENISTIRTLASHLRINATKQEYEIATAGLGNGAQTACGVQVKANQGLLYTEGKFLDTSLGMQNCENIEKQNYCFSLPNWSVQDRSACVNAGLSDFSLNAIAASDINAENVKSQIEDAKDLDKVEAFQAVDKPQDPGTGAPGL